MRFNNYIGIDYSGAEHSDARLIGLQVCMATRDTPPERQRVNPQNPTWKWTRRAVAEWICNTLKNATEPFIIGLDHGFSFPQSYLSQQEITTWNGFLNHFDALWPLRDNYKWVRDVLDGNPPPPIGDKTDLRLTEVRTKTAKSVFNFSAKQGNVAFSTVCGISWLKYIRDQFPDRSKVHFWPFDGWTPPSGAHVICEVYPSIFRNRYDSKGLNEHARDAFVVASWLKDMDGRPGALERYFSPVLTDEDKRVAEVEGWILGVL